MKAKAISRLKIELAIGALWVARFVVGIAIVLCWPVRLLVACLLRWLPNPEKKTEAAPRHSHPK